MDNKSTNGKFYLLFYTHCIHRIASLRVEFCLVGYRPFPSLDESTTKPAKSDEILSTSDTLRVPTLPVPPSNSHLGQGVHRCVMMCLPRLCRSVGPSLTARTRSDGYWIAYSHICQSWRCGLVLCWGTETSREQSLSHIQWFRWSFATECQCLLCRESLQ